MQRSKDTRDRRVYSREQYRKNRVKRLLNQAAYDRAHVRERAIYAADYGRRRRAAEPSLGARRSTGMGSGFIMQRLNHLRQRYSLTHEGYMALLASQAGVCAICSLPESSRNRQGTIRPLAVDHDHMTGAIRGLLCNRCNRGIGSFRDEPQLVQRALDYLISAKTTSI